MSGWERWGKRILKGFLWAPIFLGLAWALGIEPTWQVFLLVAACSIWSAALDAIWPTLPAPMTTTDGETK